MPGGSPAELILLVARGTSDNAAQFGRYLLEITTGIPVSLAAASVFTLYEASVDLKKSWWWRFRSPANLPTPSRSWRRPGDRAPSTSGSPTNRRAFSPAPRIMSCWFARQGAQHRGHQDLHRPGAAASICWPTPSVPGCGWMTCAACRNGPAGRWRPSPRFTAVWNQVRSAANRGA